VINKSSSPNPVIVSQAQKYVTICIFIYLISSIALPFLYFDVMVIIVHASASAPSTLMDRCSSMLKLSLPDCILNIFVAITDSGIMYLTLH
jgi:hypothetical protein